MFWTAQKLLYTTEPDLGSLKKNAQQCCASNDKLQFQHLKVIKPMESFQKINDWKKSALFIKEWWSGAHSIFKNGSERVSALIFFLMSESWAKLKKLMSVEHVGW